MPSVTETPWRLAALPPLPLEAFRGALGDLPVEVVLPATRDDAGLAAVLADADLVWGDWSGRLGIGAPQLARAPRLAFVQQGSVGTDHYDLAALTAAGVPLANTAGANAVSVAEWCLAATFGLLRQLVWADTEVRAGRWPQLDLAVRGSSELAGKRVGLLGFGAIGQACASRFAALGCTVSYATRTRRPASVEAGALHVDLDTLLATSDVLVVVVALAPQTRGLLDAAALARLPRGAIVVNAARGGILDEDAVVSACDDGVLGGAAFDVYGMEPLQEGSPLRGCDRVLLHPHASGATVQAQMRILGQTVANLRRVICGEAPVDVVNGLEGIVRRRV